MSAADYENLTAGAALMRYIPTPRPAEGDAGVIRRGLDRDLRSASRPSAVCRGPEPRADGGTT